MQKFIFFTFASILQLSLNPEVFIGIQQACFIVVLVVASFSSSFSIWKKKKQKDY